MIGVAADGLPGNRPKRPVISQDIAHTAEDEDHPGAATALDALKHEQLQQDDGCGIRSEGVADSSRRDLPDHLCVRGEAGLGLGVAHKRRQEGQRDHGQHRLVPQHVQV
jgi:hypothetical protein